MISYSKYKLLKEESPPGGAPSPPAGAPPGGAPPVGAPPVGGSDPMPPPGFGGGGGLSPSMGAPDMGGMGGMHGIDIGYRQRHPQYSDRQLRYRHSIPLHPYLDFVMFLFLAFMLSFVILPGAALYASGNPLYYLGTSLVCTIISYFIYFHLFYPTLN